MDRRGGKTTSNSSIRPTRPGDSGDGAATDGSLDLGAADRLAAIEGALFEVRQTLDVQFKRIAAMQAQLDQLMLRSRE